MVLMITQLKEMIGYAKTCEDLSQLYYKRQIYCVSVLLLFIRNLHLFTMTDLKQKVRESKYFWHKFPTFDILSNPYAFSLSSSDNWRNYNDDFSITIIEL